MSQARPSRILIAVDGSTRAPAVLAAGLGLACAPDTQVIVLRCVGLPTELDRSLLGSTPSAIEAALVAAAERETAALVAASGATTPVRVRVEVGVAAPTILRVAEDENAELLVLGAHGYRWAERVLGTTASRVVDSSTRSVLVVR